jgi:hypothetical protein
MSVDKACWSIKGKKAFGVLGLWILVWMSSTRIEIGTDQCEECRQVGDNKNGYIDDIPGYKFLETVPKKT